MGSDLHLAERMGENLDETFRRYREFQDRHPIEISTEMAQKIGRVVAAAEKTRRAYGVGTRRAQPASLGELWSALDDLYNT